MKFKIYLEIILINIKLIDFKKIEKKYFLNNKIINK